jgi:hypothetical protein
MTEPMTREQVEALLAGSTDGPWVYRPNKFDDWGFVRGPATDEFGLTFICQVKDPARLDDDTLNAHRVSGTDPWEANARLVASAPDLAQTCLATMTELEQVKGERRNIVSHATMGGTDGEGMSVNAISVKITALRNELYQEAKTAALDDAEATQAADLKAHEKEIAVWSENYAALERERDEARLKLTDKEQIYTSAIEQWSARAEAAETALAAMTEREGVLREAMAAARLDIARERPFAASDRLTAALQRKPQDSDSLADSGG